LKHWTPAAKVLASRMKNVALWFSFAATVWCANDLMAAAFNIPTPATLSLKATQGGMRVTYRGATNFQYLVQTSSNLQNWSLLSSNVATNPAVSFLDSQTNRQARFYKAASLRTPLLYRGTNFGGELGGFVLLARTNNSTVFMGVNLTQSSAHNKRGEYTTALTVDSNNVICGTYILGAPGCLQITPSNTLSGKFTNGLQLTGTTSGTLRPNTGPYNGYAGIYSGTVQGHDGPAVLLLCPDGLLAFLRTDGNKDDGTVSVMGNNDTVDAYLNGASAVYFHVTGSFQRLNRTFSLIIHEQDGSISTVAMNMTESLF
jgi:hypothetical protein